MKKNKDDMFVEIIDKIGSQNLPLKRDILSGKIKIGTSFKKSQFLKLHGLDIPNLENMTDSNFIDFVRSL